MAKRFTDTDKWKKVWFRKLKPSHKCLWMYICDNCSQIGIWEVDFESAEFFIGEKLIIDEIKTAFAKQFEELNLGKQWQIKDFISFQYGELVENNNFHKSLINQIKKAGADEPLVRGCCGDKVKDKGTDKVKDKEKGDREVAGEKEPKPADLKDLWNKTIKESKAQLPECRELSDSRISKCRLRISERPLEEWEKIFSVMAKTPFLNGQNNSGWRATFDWIIANKDNAIKVIEGKYEGNGGKNDTKNGSSGGQKAVAGKYADFM